MRERPGRNTENDGSAVISEKLGHFMTGNTAGHLETGCHPARHPVSELLRAAPPSHTGASGAGRSESELRHLCAQGSLPAWSELPLSRGWCVERELGPPFSEPDTGPFSHPFFSGVSFPQRPSEMCSHGGLSADARSFSARPCGGRCHLATIPSPVLRQSMAACLAHAWQDCRADGEL